MTTLTATTLLSRPHHDGSYLLERPDDLGQEAVVRLRVPRATTADNVLLRYTCDGEPRAVQAEIDEENDTEVWWRASFPVWNPVTRYRWAVVGESSEFQWVNGLGSVGHDVPDDDDFVIGVGPGGPDWHLDSVVYEIFPDRFATSGLEVEVPEWAIPRAWEEPPTGRGPATQYEWYGGDLRGIEQRLDHIESLGANLIYLTPIFPAGTTHRYDATTFDRVDPLLGGDEALASLTAAAHARGIRIVGDLTLNHVGSSHEWFQAALADPNAPERDFFYFDDSLETGYATWMGVPHLPKLDHRSVELRERLESVISRWLRPPFDLDGWRIDVANMTGRYRDIDVNAEVASWARRTVTQARPDALLISEHGHDPRHDLEPGKWQGTMNYAGFLRPVWSWLREAKLEDPFYDVVTRSRPAGEAVAAMRVFRAGVPWQSTLHSWTLLDSHDTPRFRNVVESARRRTVGIGLQMTTPGVPMVYAGDELGLEGTWGEDGRRTMPWHQPESWDHELLGEYRPLIALRRASDALARGGIRYAFVGDDAIAYLRETQNERLLCLASRAEHEPIRLPVSELSATEIEPHYGTAAHRDGGELVLPGDGPAFHVWRLEA
jgi:alpha-glucosidase